VQVDKVNRIVFYDGECGFCNRTVQRLLVLDKHRLLKFAPLQGATAAAVLPVELIRDMSTMVYYREGKMYVRSNAVLRLFSDITWYGKLVLIMLGIPRFVRDGIYNWVARNRHRLSDVAYCKLPEPKDRTRFLG
jgi:predicted DCC family thiol-disulfide oxidoreductase YuxK